MPRPHIGGTPAPAGNNVATPGHGRRIVETVVTILLAHIAPVRRIGRRRHALIPNRCFVSTLPENVLQDYQIRYPKAEQREM
jgi:hypothetical protein